MNPEFDTWSSKQKELHRRVEPKFLIVCSSRECPLMSGHAYISKCDCHHENHYIRSDAKSKAMLFHSFHDAYAIVDEIKRNGSRLGSFDLCVLPEYIFPDDDMCDSDGPSTKLIRLTLDYVARNVRDMCHHNAVLAPLHGIDVTEAIFKVKIDSFVDEAVARLTK